MDILNTLQEIFRDIFDDEELVISHESSASDIEGWDSFAQVNIIVACESEFGIKFELDDIARINNVGDIISHIEARASS